MCDLHIIGDCIFLDGTKVGDLLPDILPSLRDKARRMIDGADAEAEWFSKVDELEDNIRWLEEDKEDLQNDLDDAEQEIKELKEKLKGKQDAIA